MGTAAEPGRNDGKLEVRAPRSLIAEVRRIAARNDRSAAGEVRRALAEHVERQRRQPEEVKS
jgi:hypothetical protein